MSVVTMASPSDCMANTCSGGGRRRRRRQRRRHHRGARGGFLLVDLAAGERAQFLRRDDLHAGHQQRGRAFEIDLRGS